MIIWFGSAPTGPATIICTQAACGTGWMDGQIQAGGIFEQLSAPSKWAAILSEETCITIVPSSHWGMVVPTHHAAQRLPPHKQLRRPPCRLGSPHHLPGPGLRIPPGERKTGLREPSRQQPVGTWTPRSLLTGPQRGRERPWGQWQCHREKMRHICQVGPGHGVPRQDGGTLRGRERHSGELRGHPGVIMRVRKAGDQDGRGQGQRRVVAT